MIVEEFAQLGRLTVAEVDDSSTMGGGEGPIAQVRPRRHFERLEPFAGCPSADVGEAAVR